MKHNLKSAAKAVVLATLAATVFALSACTEDQNNAANPNEQNNQSQSSTQDENSESEAKTPIVGEARHGNYYFHLWSSENISLKQDGVASLTKFPIPAKTLESMIQEIFIEVPGEAKCEGDLSDSSAPPVKCELLDVNGASNDAYVYGLDDKDGSAGAIISYGEELPEEVSSRLNGSAIYAYGQGAMFGVADSVPAEQLSFAATQTLKYGFKVSPKEEPVIESDVLCQEALGTVMDGPSIIPCTIAVSNTELHAVAIGTQLANTNDRGILLIVDLP